MQEHTQVHPPCPAANFRVAMEQSLADGKHRGKDPAGMETAVKMSCTKQKEIEQQENTCPSFFPFLLEIHQKEKAGKQKKRG